MNDLASIAKALLASGKGIFAADESPTSADKRLSSHGEKPGALSRWEFRDLFLATPGIEEYLTGVILHEETLFQTADNDVSFSKLLRGRGIIPGIKVDEGTEPLPGNPDELITKGLIGLPERLADYRDRHEAGFTKWRAVIKIDGDRLPSSAALVENAKRLATYARNVQEAGMVPIVEPEVLYDGSHSRLRSKEVIEQTLTTVISALVDNAVDLGGLIVKTSMALSGKETKRIDAPEDVAKDTVAALMSAVPKEVAGVVFLSGGQTPEQSMANLAAIEKEAKAMHAPWPLTFSFSRAFQDDALDIWQGKDENVEAAREAFRKRLKEACATLAG